MVSPMSKLMSMRKAERALVQVLVSSITMPTSFLDSDHKQDYRKFSCPLMLPKYHYPKL